MCRFAETSIGFSLIDSTAINLSVVGVLAVKIRNNTGPRTLPCETPDSVS